MVVDNRLLGKFKLKVLLAMEAVKVELEEDVATNPTKVVPKVDELVPPLAMGRRPETLLPPRPIALAVICCPESVK